MIVLSPRVTVHPPKLPETGPGLKSEWFQEFEGQSYPVLEFEIEIRTLTRVKGYKLDFTLSLMHAPVAKHRVLLRPFLSIVHYLQKYSTSTLYDGCMDASLS